MKAPKPHDITSKKDRLIAEKFFFLGRNLFQYLDSSKSGSGRVGDNDVASFECDVREDGLTV